MIKNEPMSAGEMRVGRKTAMEAQRRARARKLVELGEGEVPVVKIGEKKVDEREWQDFLEERNKGKGIEDLRLSDVDYNLLSRPDVFAQVFLGLPLYKKQADVLKEFEEEGAKVGLRAANGVGKTAMIVAPLIVWHLKMFPKGIVVSTAGVARQIEDQLQRYLRDYCSKLGIRDIVQGKIRNGEGGEWSGFTANDAGKFEGYHGNTKETPLMIIIDEAKSVSDDIFTAIDRCTHQRLLVTSSPGACQGRFYETFSRNPQGFKLHHISRRDCPHLDPAKEKLLLAQYGSEDSPLFRSMVLGEFTPNNDDNIIKLTSIEKAVNNPPPFDKNNLRKMAFVDFGAGTAETVLAVNTGNRVDIEAAFVESSTDATIGRLIREFKRLGLKSWQIRCDNGGIGIPMIDSLVAAGWPVIRCNFGGRARREMAYTSWGAEAWYETGLLLDRHKIILPDDDVLINQLATRKKATRTHGNKLGIQSKAEMSGPSPDRADAVVGCLWGWQSEENYRNDEKKLDMFDFLDNGDDNNSQKWAGMQRKYGADAGI